MAYAALVSVSQTVEQILDFDPNFFPCTKVDKEKVESFQETIASLIDFLDNCPPICTQRVNNLITQIRDSAYEAEDVFESHISTHFLQKYESDGYEKFKMLHQSLDEVMEDINSIEKEVKNFHQDGYGVHKLRIRTLARSSRQLVSVLKTLKQVLYSDPYFLPLTEEKVESVREIIDSLIAFRDNCPPFRTQQVYSLIEEIRISAYEAEDVFESLVAILSDQLKYGGDRYEKFKMFPQSLEKVMEDFESIDKEVKKIHQDGDVVHKLRILTLASSTRSASRGNNTMVSLDNDLEIQLMEQLVGGRSKIDIIPIVGMGGIGKTTLARILYNSKLINESFDIRGWATVSQTYNVQEIFSDILKDIGLPLEGQKDGEQLLYQSLYYRKYLIVLDDVWNTQAWDDIKGLFPDNDNGSRIILTTRHSEVAAYANSFGTYHEMKLLNEDSSWNLLCQEIFLQNDCPSELVDIGKEIARQCQGLPLAISAIGGHLRKEKQIKEYWKYVSENISSVLRTGNDPSLEILTLSYNYLPYHLRACFLYFGSFQEGHPIDVSRIVKLWVAEGFVKPSRSNSMEEVAEEYLLDVIGRNLVFVYKYDSVGKPERCGVHDLFRDICIREAKKEKILYNLDMNISCDLKEINSQRRVILGPNVIEDEESPSSIVSRNGCCSITRSLICLGSHDISSSTIKLASGLLKVLNIRMKSIKFPIEILKLVNLKYLELGSVLEIPSSISGLKNLQTLIARPIYENSIPSEIWEMSQLRHLLIFGFRLPDVPNVQGNRTDAYVLKSLQTLSRVMDFRCSQEITTRIPNLKKLSIWYDKDTAGLSFHSLNNLVYLSELESLRCGCNFVPNDNISWSLVFPSSLKKLVLLGCKIPWEQMTIIGILPFLEVLKLKDGATRGKFWETNDGEFEQLKFLLIQGSDLVEWKTEKDHFPRLQHLTLEHCYDLEAIPSEVGDISTLERIELNNCSLAAEFSAKEMLSEDGDIELIIISRYEMILDII